MLLPAAPRRPDHHPSRQPQHFTPQQKGYDTHKDMISYI